MSNVSETIELTDAIVRAATCPEGKSEYFLRDTKQPGLALRLRASGGKTYVVLGMRRAGRRGTAPVRIDTAANLSVAAARNQAKIIIGQKAGVAGNAWCSPDRAIEPRAGTAAAAI